MHITLMNCCQLDEDKSILLPSLCVGSAKVENDSILTRYNTNKICYTLPLHKQLITSSRQCEKAKNMKELQLSKLVLCKSVECVFAHPFVWLRA